MCYGTSFSACYVFYGWLCKHKHRGQAEKKRRITVTFFSQGRVRLYHTSPDGHIHSTLTCSYDCAQFVNEAIKEKARPRKVMPKNKLKSAERQHLRVKVEKQLT